MESGSLPESRHFVLQSLQEGIYSAIAADGGWAICNAGVVDLGDQTLVFDTFVNQRAASDLKGAAERLTGREVSTVMNSHFHSDHVKGNQVFVGTRIVSTTKTREVMEGAKRRYETELETIRKSVQEDLDARLANPSDPDTILFEGYDRGHLEGLPTLKYTLPNLTFDSKMTFQGSKRAAEALTFGGGHTVSDSILYLPESEIAFMGDLLFVKCHPWIADGDPEELFRVLDKVEALDAKMLVPGHGPLGTPEDVTQMRRYIETLQKTADTTRGSAGIENQALGLRSDSPFSEWKWRSFYKDNLDFLLQRTAVHG